MLSPPSLYDKCLTVVAESISTLDVSHLPVLIRDDLVARLVWSGRLVDSVVLQVFDSSSTSLTLNAANGHPNSEGVSIMDEVVKRASESLRHVCVSDWSDTRSLALHDLVLAAPNLESVKFDRCNAFNQLFFTPVCDREDEPFQVPLRFSVELHDWVSDSAQSTALAPTLFSQTTLRRERLVHVTIEAAAWFTDEGVAVMAQACPNLLSLSLVSCTSVSSRGVTAVAYCCPHLTAIKLDRTVVDDVGVAALVKGCKDLQTIGLNMCSELSDVCVSILASFESITDLDVSGNKSLRCLENLFRSSTGHKLVHLRLNRSAFVDEAVETLAEHCPNLRTLHCAETYLSDEALSHLVSRCEGLTDVNLSWCNEIGDRSVSQLALSCPNLRRLSLRTCSDVTSAAVMALSVGCSHLEALDLARIGDISNEALVSIGQNCRFLKQLDVSWSWSVKDSGVEQVFRSCPLMETLVLSGCKQLTLGFVDEEALSLLPKLVFLDLSYCDMVKDKELAELAARMTRRPRPLTVYTYFELMNCCTHDEMAWSGDTEALPE